MQEEECCRFERRNVSAAATAQHMNQSVFVMEPFEHRRQRFSQHLRLDRFHHGNAQRLLNDNEVVVGHAKGVHVGWMQCPLRRYTGDDMSVVESIRSVGEANHVVVWRIVRNGHAQVVDLNEYRLLDWSNGSK